MTIQRMIELLEIEHECMLRGAHDDCDRNCADCELVQDDGDLHEMYTDVIALLKEQQSLLGIQQTADGITFISTGTAKQGEERGILLGKLLMNEWIYKELLYKGLLTDDIRSVLEQAKGI